MVSAHRYLLGYKETDTVGSRPSSLVRCVYGVPQLFVEGKVHILCQECIEFCKNGYPSGHCKQPYKRLSHSSGVSGVPLKLFFEAPHLSSYRICFQQSPVMELFFVMPIGPEMLECSIPPLSIPLEQTFLVFVTANVASCVDFLPDDVSKACQGPLGRLVLRFSPYSCYLGLLVLLALLARHFPSARQ